MWHGLLSCDMDYCHVTWVIVMWHELLSCDMGYCRVTWVIVMWHGLLSCDMSYCHVTWVIVMWHGLLSCDMSYCHVTWVIFMWHGLLSTVTCQQIHVKHQSKRWPYNAANAKKATDHWSTQTLHLSSLMVLAFTSFRSLLTKELSQVQSTVISCVACSLLNARDHSWDSWLTAYSTS